MSINANELRIGSWVQGSLNDVYQRPFQVSMRDFSLPDFFNNVRPIPLTPSVLDRCGFKLNRDLPMKLGDFEVGLDGDDFVKNLMTVRYKKSIVVKVGSLHQLQNLYFALAGEELNYQP